MKIDVNRLEQMITHMETYLPEDWQKEEWFKEGRKAVKNIRSKAENLPISDVRLSVLQQVWQRWCEATSEDDFDKWLHDQMHEA